jgi:hypothetical protein
MCKQLAGTFLLVWSVFTLMGNNFSANIFGAQALLSHPKAATATHHCCTIPFEANSGHDCCQKQTPPSSDDNACSHGSSSKHNDDCNSHRNCSHVCCQSLTSTTPVDNFCLASPTTPFVQTYPSLYSLNLPQPFIGCDSPPPNVA